MDKSTEIAILAAYGVARGIRASKGRTRGRMIGPDTGDEQALEDLAKSWEDFANRLDVISQANERR